MLLFFLCLLPLFSLVVVIRKDSDLRESVPRCTTTVHEDPTFQCCAEDPIPPRLRGENQNIWDGKVSSGLIISPGSWVRFWRRRILLFFFCAFFSSSFPAEGGGVTRALRSLARRPGGDRPLHVGGVVLPGDGGGRWPPFEGGVRSRDSRGGAGRVLRWDSEPADGRGG